MKNLIAALPIFLILLMPVFSYAQSPLNTDSAFEDQRQRVNKLLNERNHKFGEYDTSLLQKTGIFGLFKSKGDMQKSIDILKQIVITDNNIFLETRKLLDLKDSERAHFEQLASSYDDQITAYMKTISKLQAENEKLRQTISSLEEEDHDNNTYLYLSIMLIIGMAVALIYQYRLLQSKNVTKV